MKKVTEQTTRKYLDCGTVKAWARHQRNGEKCIACTQARAEYDKKYLAVQANKERAKERAKAQTWAVSQLRLVYPNTPRKLIEKLYKERYLELYRQRLKEIRDGNSEST